MSSTPTPKAEAGRRRPAPRRAGASDLDLLREILDAAPARVCYVDRDRRYRYVNREFCAFAQKTPEEIIGLTSEELVGPQVRARLEPWTQAALRGEVVVREGWVDYRLNGRKYIHWVFSPKRDAAGEVEGFFLFMRDLTEQKEHEEELTRRSEQLAAILENVADGVNIVDAEGRLVLCNRGFLDMYGFPEALGRPGTPIAAFVQDRLRRGQHYRAEDRARPVEQLVAERVARVLATGDELQEEVGPEGRSFFVRRRRLADGAIVSTYHDITAQRQAEVAQRAQRDALRRAEALGATASLLAGVAHEINNPLAVVAAQALLLAEEAEGTPLAARAEKVREAAQRCGRIVASLMASARRRAPRRDPIELRAAVAAAIDLAGYGLRGAGIALELDLPQALPPLRGDPDQVVHLIANLVSNARHALAERPPPRRLQVALRAEAGMVELRVADNGAGIPEALRERVFDPFFTTKPDGSGTGVGLALCRTIAQAHGGRIHAEATPGGGATLVVRLPAAE